MMIRKPVFNRALLFVFGTLSMFAMFADAGELYNYQGTSGFAKEFHLIGGQYTLYLYVKRPIKGYNAPESKSCIFGGNLQRVWPTHDVISLGSGITLSTIVPHKIGPTAVNMPAGLYRIFIATLTTCDWHFILESTKQNTAGLAPVRMFKINQDRAGFSESASVVQMVHHGEAIQTFPLQTGIDQTTQSMTCSNTLLHRTNIAHFLYKTLYSAKMQPPSICRQCLSASLTRWPKSRKTGMPEPKSTG